MPMLDLTIFGTVLLLLGAAALCRNIFLRYDRTLQSYGELLRLLYVLRQKISTSALSPDKILDSDEGFDLLVSSGFISCAREKGLHIAFEETEKMFFMDKEDKDMLHKYFSGFGGYMISAELENLSMVIESLEKKNGQIKSETPSKKKVASTVIVCCALMLIILII